MCIYLSFSHYSDAIHPPPIMDLPSIRPTLDVSLGRSLFMGLQRSEGSVRNRCDRVPVYGELSPEFSTSSGGGCGCLLSPFIFSFIIDLIL